MDNTTKKVLQFLARIIRWQSMFIRASGWDMDLKSKERLNNIIKGDFSDFKEDNS